MSGRWLTEKQGNLSYRTQMLSDSMVGLLVGQNQRSVYTFLRIYLMVTKMLGCIQSKMASKEAKGGPR